jgi:hypothetical protein
MPVRTRREYLPVGCGLDILEDMTARFHLRAPARACGFAAGWALFTLALLVATRPMGLGPGFSRPLPYALAALFISIAGHLLHRWLHPASGPGFPAAGPEAGAKTGALRRIFQEPLRGLGGFFRGTAAFNNFIFLTLAYILGIGLTSLFIRKPIPEKPDGRKPTAANAGASSIIPSHDASSTTYWRDLNLGKQDADAYYRPF